ncbi:hypothetical protein Zmor_020253 [Zophobas morio]|uniref:Uncharacterized protein n=1 Tax=Zophobas morio TaxID=2755281 RepID=A0AA38I3L7_9CUCU|nr:hypothetical protein Zmor_020253 [Zophobas morio]
MSSPRHPSSNESPTIPHILDPLYKHQKGKRNRGQIWKATALLSTFSPMPPFPSPSFPSFTTLFTLHDLWELPKRGCTCPTKTTESGVCSDASIR